MKTLSFFLICLLATSCDYSADNDKFTLPRQNYTGNQLRVDGYYYIIISNPDIYITPYFLYRNGILFEPGVKYKPAEYDRWVKAVSAKNYPQTLASESWWGQFVIEDSIIKFEKYYPGDGPLWSYIREGVILNDTTFHITKIYRSNGDELREKDEMYHFRKFSPKPDSTNVFIK